MYFDLKLWDFTVGVRGRIALSVLIGALSSFLGVARLALLGWLLGLVFNGAPWQTLASAGVVIGAVIVLRGGMEYARTMVAHGTAARVQLHLRALLYDQLVALGPAHFGLTRTGDLLVTLVDGVEHLEVYFGKYLPQFFIAGLTPVLIFALLVALDWPVALVLVFFALVTLVAPSAFHRWDSANSMARSKAYGELAAEFLDAIQGLATLKVFGQSAARAALLAEKAHALFRSTMWVLATNALSRGITDTGIAVGAASALALGAWRVSQGAMSFEALLIVLMLGVEVFRPLRDLRAMLHEGMLARAAANKIFALLESRPQIVDTSAADQGEALAPTLAFEDVRFTYPGGRGRIHDGLDFDIAAGERIGIVGASGAGKSSIVRLLLRLYDPEAGRVRVGGHDLKDLSFAAIRRQFAVVQQDTHLFHGTVADNLRFGKSAATAAEMEAAARAANAHDFIGQLPQGYDTIVGERGIRLSGGQRQRIAIARALLRDAPILILDEALSAVDAENEAVIQDALDRLMSGRTTLILAHRLSSVIDTDRILVLDEGRVVEAGSHDALMARRGAYYSLMAAQALDRSGGADSGGTASELLELEAAPVFAAGEQTGGERADDIIGAEGLGWLGAIELLMSYIRPWRRKLVATFTLGILRVAAFIGVGVLSALAVAGIKTGGPTFVYLAFLLALAPAAGVFHWFESWIAHDMAFRLLAEMRIALFRKIDSLAPAYLVRRRTGDLVAMATNDVELVEFFFAHTIAPAFVAVLVPAAVLVTLGAFHFGLIAALGPFLGLVALSPFVLRRRIDRLASRDREALGALNAHTVETVQGMSEIVAFQREVERRGEFLDLVRGHQAVRLPFFGDMTAQAALVEVVTTLGGLAIVLAGGWLVQAGAMQATYLPLLTLLAMAAFLPISEISEIGRQLADTLGATRRLANLEGEEPAVVDGTAQLETEPGEGLAVAFEQVGFSYQGTLRPAVQEVSFAVPAGATAALVGRSGAGKSTCAHLLLRFWDPSEGRLTLAGRELKDYRLNEMRRAVALVSQDTFLFNDTLKANIQMAKPEASAAEVAAAVERAALAEFVASLPDGLETRVGERGMTLSGGQRQRVAIARAFLSDAPVLVLDEATSHLDAVNERLVHAALRELMKHRTTLVIAHRLSTVREADLIVVLDQGRVVETGRHADLLAAGGLYSGLVRRQLTAATSRTRQAV